MVTINRRIDIRADRLRDENYVATEYLSELMEVERLGRRVQGRIWEA